MVSATETIQAVQKGAAPYIRPREEASRIRRILAAHLNSCLETEAAGTPLALVEASFRAPLPPEARGSHREFLKALEANAKARKEFEEVRRQHVQSSALTTSTSFEASDRLEDHLVAIKLQKKSEKLKVVDKYLKLINQQPAASTDSFLDPEDIFKDAVKLPEVPRAVVEGVAADKDAAKTDLKDLASQLEKSVLRAKLLLKKEERLLDKIKARSATLPEHISDGARFHALSVSRSELISWIESELGKASGEEASEEISQLAAKDGPLAADEADVQDKLASIKEKYARYLAARKALINTINQNASQDICLPPPSQEPTTMLATNQQQPAPAATYLLSPYLENLLSVAHEQKGLITQKAHLNIALAKQLKDSCQIIDHLAAESQLLPAFPLPGSSTRRRGVGDGLGAPESLDISSRMKDWVFAADSAKIATLETVAEQVENGQIALEGSMKALGEVDRLFGRGERQETGERDKPDDDIWLTQEQEQEQLGKGANRGRKTDKTSASQEQDGNIWSVLDGSLGLIKSDEHHT